MTKIFLSIALLLQLSTMQGLPCSEYYTYLKKPGTNEILGRIEIPSHPRNVQYHLRVGFNTQPWIHRNGPVARLEVAQRTKKTIGALQQGRPLLYHVHFPVGQAIPRLTKIWFNDQQLCPNPEGTEYLRTTFVIEQMYPSGTEPLSLNSSSYQNSSTIVNSSLTNYISEGINKKIIPKTIRTKKSVQYNNNNISNNDNNNNNECSISDDNDDINLMVAYGLQTSSERWPWLVALFIFKEEVYKFACSGSILTTKHVITAAHCMSSVSNVHPNVLVILGKFNMTQWQEEQEVIKREIVSYKIHPDYAHTTSGDSDLAILTLKIPIEFSPFIKPVCLWSGPANLQNIINRIGYVVGWGMTELGHFSEEPHMTGMPIVNQRTCLDSHKRFSILTSERTFCAGWRNGSGPCNGDSGSGLMLFNDTTNRYQMRGLVSRSLLLRENKLSCDLRNYVVFVDVAKYIPWIQEQTSMENRPTSAEPTSQTDNYDECGISTYREDINLLIANGQNTLPGQWPWLAAVFTIQNFTKGFEFRCVGTILSTHHVLTAAYCLEHMNDWSKPLSTLEVALGRFNLRYIREEGTVIRKVSYYRVYPNDHPNRGSGDSHWAILILTPPIEFNPFIRSICLWSGSTTFQDVVGKTGYVVGWGEGEYGHPYTEQPRMGKMKIVTKEKCFRDEGIDDAMLLNFNFTTENIFCAQSRSSPCNSDSGSGLIFFNNTINRYQLRGMVLRPMLHRNTLIRPSCSGMDSFLFIDLAKYTPWIQEKISAEQPYYKPTLPLQNINRYTCDASQYGCCPDGIEEAQGENFEGCLTVPSMPGASCGLEKDRGSCRDFTVKWFYDTDYGGCSRFWYGGCEGNENRFETKEECKEVCIQPKGKAACFLPKIAGFCEGSHSTWYYDVSRKQCDQFIYSGCFGNANKFKTREECEELCVTLDDVDNNYNECGISQYREDLLITHGQDTPQWPWMVTLFVRDENRSFYRTGTILTTRHVLTAAHCLGKFVRIGNYTVFDLIHYSVIDVALGLWKYRMTDYTHESVIRDLASYKIHPDYKHGKSSDADLAILILRIPVEFNHFIRPICLWSGSTILQDVVGRIGYVVGWPEQTGWLAFSTMTFRQRILKASIMNQENCRQNHENISTFTSERTFCADWRNISDSCTKCDGSGLVLFNDTTNRYELRGIVSHTENGDLQNYVIYVDVAKYIPWIQEQISMENMMPTLAQLYAQINN